MQKLLSEHQLRRFSFQGIFDFCIWIWRLKASSTIRAGASSVPFRISIGLLSLCRAELLKPLLLLSTAAVNEMIFSEIWKISYTSSIPKASLDATLPLNWRPISLLDPVSKLFKKFLSMTLKSHLQKHGLLSRNQFGFRKKHSAELLILLVVRQWENALAAGFEIDLVFLTAARPSIRYSMTSFWNPWQLWVLTVGYWFRWQTLCVAGVKLR